MTQDPLAPFRGAELAPFANPQATEPPGTLLTAGAIDQAREAICTWPGYEPTPLVALPGLAKAAGLGALYYKDEGGRFGLGSFKALGGAYAVYRLLAGELEKRHGIAPLSGEALRDGGHRALTQEITVASATDGNHGRSVAWGARLFGCRCVIYIHAEVSAGREAALKAQGADVVRVTGNYDDSVRQCAEDADANGWVVVSDTSWEGYREIPGDVMAGYSVMASEIVEQLGEQPPSHVFVQGGVGGIAGTLCDVFHKAWGAKRPRFLVVEPELAACLHASARAGRPAVVEIEEETLMAGLSCGEVSMIAWDTLASGADDFLTVSEDLVAPAMTLLADGPFGDPALVAGESAVAGLAAALAGATAGALGLDETSRVLVIGTEGATDPEIYQHLTGRQAA
ncbi:MAG: diaminopropionate ammonia-lyase [Pseudomonadota bacterium]